MIVLARVDDRLVHGQVAVGWKNALDANHLAVIDDHIASDMFERSLLEMSVPYELELSIFSTEDAIRELPKFVHDPGLRSIILVKNPQIFIPLLESGIDLTEVNIGGMRFAKGKEQITKAVFLNAEERETVKQLSARGIIIDWRIVPTDKRGDYLTQL